MNMAKWLVKASRDAAEEAAAIVEAADEAGAREAFTTLDFEHKLDWHPGGEMATNDFDIFGVEQVDDQEPLGIETCEIATVERSGHILLAAAGGLLNFMTGLDSVQARALAAAVDLAKGGLGGWELFDWNGTGLNHIERDDEEGIFDTDEEAVAFVRLCAGLGDRRASDALVIHEENEPKISTARAARRIER